MKVKLITLASGRVIRISQVLAGGAVFELFQSDATLKMDKKIGQFIMTADELSEVSAALVDVK
jgi:hypothetical protein